MSSLDWADSTVLSFVIKDKISYSFLYDNCSSELFTNASIYEFAT